MVVAMRLIRNFFWFPEIFTLSIVNAEINTLDTLL